MKHDASRSAGLILRDSVQLRAEIVHLNQAELHKGNKFDVEPGANGGGQGRIGSQAERATPGHNGTCARKSYSPAILSLLRSKRERMVKLSSPMTLGGRIGTYERACSRHRRRRNFR